jgi:tripartite ATP-independent transporter DctM subunit
MTPTAIGALGIVAMLVLIFWGTPIGVAMGLVGFVGFALMSGLDPALAVLGIGPFSSVSSYTLTVIPLFVLMGQFAAMSGLSRELYDTANRWLGHRRGGLAMANVVACGGFAAVCGSSLATSATMAVVALPEMRRAGYDPKLATGSIAAGGTLGILIPPSVIFLLYGILTEQSIGKLFLAGVLPGILLVLLYMAAIAIVTWRNPALGPATARVPVRERIVALRRVWPVLGLFLLVIGGMYVGVFTATEAAAIGAAGAFLLAFARRAVTWRTLGLALIETVQTTAMIFGIVIGAILLGFFLAITQLPMTIAAAIGGLPLPANAIMALIILLYLIMGAFMDELAMVLLTVPIFFPVAQALGFDPIWFGVIIVVVCEAGMIAPPVGINVFVLAGIAKDVPMKDIYRGIMPFLWADVVLLVALMAFPDLALVLPRTMK